MAGALSLEDAIRAKYCSVQRAGDTDTLPPTSREGTNESALKFRPGGLPVQRCSSIVLDGRRVSGVQSEDELGELCPLVEEMHLRDNCISQCKDLLAVISALPRLRVLDLTKNPLDCSSFTSPASIQTLSALTTLVLNGTSVSWSAVQLSLEMLPQLEELHLCKNGHNSVDLPSDFQHLSLRRLYISYNTFSSWTECEKISRVFPRLQTLIATANPIAEVPPQGSHVFTELTSLNLNHSLLSHWEDIEHLSTLAKLKELSLLNLPLGEELQVKERRFAVVARMPGLSKLNKTTITDTEREDAERWLVRVFAGKAQQPAVYSSLSEKHGTPYQLADVDLSPKKTEKIEFYFEGGRKSETHVIKLAQSTLQLKSWVGKRIGIPSSSFRLLYFDSEGVAGPVVMKYKSRSLYMYGMKEGDQVHIQELKPSQPPHRAKQTCK